MTATFWASMECDKAVCPKVRLVWAVVEPWMNAALAGSPLADLPNLEIRYVPIIVAPEAQARYPARSRLRKKERIYVCAPQLSYDIFLADESAAHIKCYLDGLRECARRLPELGASKAQAQEFLDLLDRAYQELTAT